MPSMRASSYLVTPKRPLLFTIILATRITLAADPSCPARISFKNGATEVRLPSVAVKDHQILVTVRINGDTGDLRFVFDSGAGRTVLTRAAADHLGLRATEKSSIGGVGTGRVEVDVVKNVSLQLGDASLEGVDLNLLDDIGQDNESVGIIGYDLLCASVVTVDYKKPAVIVSAPSAFQYHGNGDILPLTFKGKWPYVRGTLKVPGLEPVTDDFLIDTGSKDGVNHPVIKQSKGELHETNTGAGGFGESLTGVIGPNEWFQIGRNRIEATESVCCPGNEDVSRQLGGQVLSHFRIIFNYPGKSIILEGAK